MFVRMFLVFYAYRYYNSLDTCIYDMYAEMLPLRVKVATMIIIFLVRGPPLTFIRHWWEMEVKMYDR